MEQNRKIIEAHKEHYERVLLNLPPRTTGPGLLMDTWMTLYLRRQALEEEQTAIRELWTERYDGYWSAPETETR